MCICAKTIGAKKAVIYLRYEYRNIKADLNKSIKEVQALHSTLANVSFEIRIGGGPYVAGEETALFESIEGKGARPRTDRNQFATACGLYNKPTVINNVETFISIPMIMNLGGEAWAKQAGNNGEKGVKLYGMCGDIPRATIVEQPVGTTLNSLLKDANLSNIEFAEIGGSTERIAPKADFEKVVGFKNAKFNGVGSIVLFNSSRNIT